MNFLSNIIKQWSRKEENIIPVSFLTVVEGGDVTEVRKRMAKGEDVNSCFSENGITALHIAAEKGDVPLLLQLLSSRSIKIEPVSIYGNTPLHITCTFQKYEAAKILLKKKANPNRVDNFEKNCLHLIAISKHIRLAKLLIKSGGHINAIDYMGNSPLHLAIDGEYMPMIKLLLLHGADPNIITKRMPLFLDCVLQCHSDTQLLIIQLLISHGVDYNVIEPISRRNAMHFVAISGYTPLAYFLLKLGCYSERRDIFNTTPEQIAIGHGNLAVADLFHTFQQYGAVDFVALRDTDIVEFEEAEEKITK